ncbi:C25 family cysteine peptidase [Bernardetia sp. ABR2-2B]|uniref:putative type IX secretion system sortase PorU2 n=1 Tax=Bernardetia sp. ABR2-2B TaxID=3127472 RepID=UPI0030D13B35
MNKHIYSFLFVLGILFSFSNKATAQLYFPPSDFSQYMDWVDYDKEYYKITINEDGLYRINFQELIDAGIPSSIDPSRLQMYYHGKEIPIKVEGEADGRLDSLDYVEFYGKRRDSEHDKLLFPDPTKRTVESHSLYGNTSVYFLTYTRVSEQGLRTQKYYQQNTDTLAAERFHIQETRRAFTTDYTFGPLYPLSFTSTNGRGCLVSDWEEGKGFASVMLTSGQNNPRRIDNLPVRNYVGDSLVEAEVGMRIVGRMNQPNKVRLVYEMNSIRRVIDEVDFENYQVVERSESIPDSLGVFQDGTVTTITEDLYSVSGRGRIAYCEGWVKYPQATRMNGESTKRFNLQANLLGKSYLEIENPTSQVRFFDITNPQNVIEIQADSVENKRTMIVPNTGQERVIYASAAIKTVSLASITKANFRPITTLDADYIILTAKNLREGFGDYPDVAQAYADYRASQEGGSYTPLIVEIDQLYNIFSYGETSPLSIRRFANYMLTNGDPKFLFILGKSTGILITNPNSNSILPYGLPGSDNMLTAGIKNGSLEPALATARLSAISPKQVIDYLNKVKEHETIEGDQSWRKRLLHLSGGYSPSEHASFKRYVEGFESIAEGQYLGAEVKTLSKKTTDFVEFIDISEEVNEGLSLITFFGHAGVNFTDIEVGKASDSRLGYANKGKYPMLLVNGCGTGNPYGAQPSLAEDWTLTADKGAILFLSHGELGFSGQLRLYTQTFYEDAFTKKENLNLPIGEVMQKMLRTYMARNGFQNEIARAAAQQITLHGDPAVRLVPITQPDYMINNSRVSLVAAENETVVNANSDKFRIKIAAKNLGIMDFDNKRISLRVRRTFPDGTADFYAVRDYPSIANEDTLYYDISVAESMKAKSIGLNKFEVYLDFFEEIAESDETNNYASFEYFMQRGTMITLAPKEYSIVNSNSPTLIAQNNNPFTEVRSYEYELDTTHLFNSSAKKSIVLQDYITTEWNVNLPVLRDSTVYYWRVRYAEPEGDDNPEWATSSFIYISNSPAGWSQSHVGQFEEATFEGVSYTEQSRKWEFKPYELNFEIQAAGATSSEKGNYFIKMNGVELVNGDCYDDRVIGVVIDDRTGTIYNPYPNEACGSSLTATGIPAIFFGVDQMNDYFDNIRDGSYVIMMNSVLMGREGRNLGRLASLGLSDEQFARLRAMRNRSAFVVVGRKGAAKGTALIVNIQGSTSVINENFTISGRSDKGIVTSSLIGPAADWGNMFRKVRESGNDKWKIDVLGESFTGFQTTLAQDVTQDNFQLSQIDANQYPYLRLRATLSDSIEKTSPQLDRWQVIYREVPEGILLYDTLSYRQNSNLQVSAGDSVDIRFRFRNISGNDFTDPLVVRYTVRNTQTGVTTESYDTLSSLARNEELLFDAKFYSLEYFGDNLLTVFMNPRIQGEQLYDNNILQANFTVIPDNVNPVLDVAFDGIKIMDGDVISPTPLISIQLRDENKFLVRQDTVGINLYLSKCDSCERVRLNYDGQNVNYFASQDNNFRLEYRPERLEDGKYTLSVDAQDESGNKAGAEEYKVNFEVINKSTLTHFYPYPNPFSTKMHFVFTLTGADVPDDIRIQIMTITGKIVRTITKDELGAIRIGDNVSDFTWDGTDEYGDKLANGVYLYKVDIRDNQLNFEHRETAKDDLFKKNIGKIYIMR